MEGIKNICQVYSFINQEGLVTTRLKELGRSGNYVAAAMNFFIPNVEEFFETILSFVQPKRNHRLSLLYLCRIHSSRCYGSKGFPV